MDALCATHEGFVSGLYRLHQKYAWEDVQAAQEHETDPRYEENADARREFWEARAAEWGLDTTTLEPLDAEADRARFQRRLHAFLTQHAGSVEGRDDVAELEAGDEDGVFAKLYAEFNLGDNGFPKPDPTELAFCLSAFHYLYRPAGLPSVAAAVDAVVTETTTLDAVFNSYQEDPAYAAAQEALASEAWLGEGHSRGALEFRFTELLKAADAGAAEEDRKAKVDNAVAECRAGKHYLDVTKTLLEAHPHLAEELWADPFPPPIRELLESAGKGGEGPPVAGPPSVVSPLGDIAQQSTAPLSRHSSVASHRSQSGAADTSKDGGKVTPPLESAPMPRAPSTSEALQAIPVAKGFSSGLLQGSRIRAGSRISDAGNSDLGRKSSVASVGGASVGAASSRNRSGTTPKLMAQEPPSRASFERRRAGAVAGSTAPGDERVAEDEAEVIALREAWLQSFFDIFAPKEMHRVSNLAPRTDLDLLSVLRSLCRQFHVPEEEWWWFSIKLRFTVDEIHHDWTGRLEEFFMAHPNAQAAREAGRVEMDNLLRRISEHHLGDVDFWPGLYEEYAVPLGEPWPASQLEGAPPARAPDPQPLSAISNTGSSTSVPEARPKRRISSAASSAAMRRAPSSVSRPPTDPQCGMVVPGVVTFRHLQASKVLANEASTKRLKAAAKWDVAKAFGYRAERTQIDALRGGVLTIYFHLATSEHDAGKVHASAKQALQQRQMKFTSLLHEYHAVVGASAPEGGDGHLGAVDWERSAVHVPRKVAEHLEHCKQLPATTEGSGLRDKLAFFHARHAPADIGNVDALAASKLDDADLFKALYARYSLGDYDGAYSGDAWRTRVEQSAPSKDGNAEDSMKEARVRVARYLEGTEYYRTHPEELAAKVELCVEALQLGATEKGLLAELAEAYPAAPKAAPEHTVDEAALRRRLTDFYLQHNPVELYKVELAMQAGLSEDVLFARLHEKYGLPPAVLRVAPGVASPGALGPTVAPRRTAQDEQLLSQMKDLFRKERALQDEAVALGSRERMMFEREVALERSAEDKDRTAAMRDASLADWERQLSQREEILRAREQSCDMRFRELADREARLAASPPPPATLLNSRSLSPPPPARLHPPQHAAPTEPALLPPQGAFVATPIPRQPPSAPQPSAQELRDRETRLMEQETRLKALGERLDVQVQQLAEKEAGVLTSEEAMSVKQAGLAQREQALAARETAVADGEARVEAVMQREIAVEERERKVASGQSSAGQIIETHLRALEEREGVVSAKEVALLQSTLRDKAQEQQREKRLASREIELDAKASELTLRENDMQMQATRVNARQARLDAREKELATREEDIEERHRRMLFEVNEQSSLNLRAREVEEHAREIEMRGRLLGDRERTLREKEQEIADMEQAIKLAQHAELAALKEKERMFLQTEEELQTRARRLEAEELRFDARRKDLVGTEEALQGQMQRIVESEGRLAKALDDAEVRSSLVAQREHALEQQEAALRAREEAVQREIEQGHRDLELRQRDLDERRREVELTKQDLNDKQGEHAVQTILLGEHEKMLQRKVEQQSKKELYVTEREWSVQQKEAMVGDALRIINKADRDQETRFQQRMGRLRQHRDAAQGGSLAHTTHAPTALLAEAGYTERVAGASALTSPLADASFAMMPPSQRSVPRTYHTRSSLQRSPSGRSGGGVDPLSPPLPLPLASGGRTVSPPRALAMPPPQRATTASSLQADLSSIRDSLVALNLRGTQPTPDGGILSPRAF
eukprot:TRINITY_DN22474_c0_g1_i1.p1 TRINITY_DN22474_c0_g1~~TRINITY_DN22474_c0_g1_i1.p1  ORF type:complete len:1775 (+),score=415.31 TRINITY_DN22474_c0_g1_i1:65-5326(+)